MKTSRDRPLKLKLWNSLCVFGLLASCLYVILNGFVATATVMLTLSLVGVAVPAVASGDGLLEILSILIEGLIEGVVLVIEGISNVLAGIFS